jgi:hypothetical protein
MEGQTKRRVAAQGDTLPCPGACSRLDIEGRLPSPRGVQSGVRAVRVVSRQFASQVRSKVPHSSLHESSR